MRAVGRELQRAMSFATVVGHNQPIDILRRAIAAGRVATAYLFVGPPNVGKTLVATEFARALNCERLPADATPEQVEACDECHNCVRIGQENHPDLHVLRPAVAIDVKQAGAEKVSDTDARAIDAESAEEDEEDAGRMRTRKQRVYIELPDALIQTERVLETIQYAYARPALGRRKIVIVVSADTMDDEAANRLLKTLEEPPRDTTLVLTTARPDRLLPTIVSRCQVVRFHALSHAALRAALGERFPDADPGALDAATALAGGRYGRAWRIMDAPELAELRGELLDLAARTGDAQLVECLALGERLMAMPEAWWAATEEAEAGGGDSESERRMKLEALEALAKSSPDRISRIQMQEILDVLQTWYRDLTLLRSAPGSELVINADRGEQLAALAPVYSPAGLVWASQVIEEARRELTVHNANLRLACQVLMVKLIAARRRR